MSTRAGYSPHSVLTIRDESWIIAGLELVLAGTLFTIIGLGMGLVRQGVLPVVLALVAVGLSTAGTGGWMVFRPRAIVVDERSAVVRVRGAIRERSLSFAELRGIQLQPRMTLFADPAVAYTSAPVYDVLLFVGDRTGHRTHLSLELSDARAEARRISDATGVPVRGEPEGYRGSA